MLAQTDVGYEDVLVRSRGAVARWVPCDSQDFVLDPLAKLGSRQRLGQVGGSAREKAPVRRNPQTDPGYDVARLAEGGDRLDRVVEGQVARHLEPADPVAENDHAPSLELLLSVIVEGVTYASCAAEAVETRDGRQPRAVIAAGSDHHTVERLGAGPCTLLPAHVVCIAVGHHFDNGRP